MSKTLGWWRDTAAAIFGKESGAVAFIEDKIKHQGEDELVIVDDGQMLVMLGMQDQEPTAQQFNGEKQA